MDAAIEAAATQKATALLCLEEDDADELEALIFCGAI